MDVRGRQASLHARSSNRRAGAGAPAGRLPRGQEAGGDALNVGGSNWPPPTGPGGAAGRSIGRYRVERELGRGGMGVVYLVHDPQLGVQRALKLLGAEAYAAPDAVARFLREARTLARLRHPNLISVVDADLAGASPYLVMPLVDGGDLASLLRTRGRLEVAEALKIVDRIARAVDFAHAEGVLHRDLKPANVLLDRDGAPLVTDFGLARDLHSREEVTKTGETMGTPRYMAPEQAAGETREVSPRSTSTRSARSSASCSPANRRSPRRRATP
ncbi:MAG: serine/threonine protein kinase [Planctomycetota bacterium]|nr:serine/threonine protein kinase [Planctomycetota bacterium]